MLMTCIRRRIFAYFFLFSIVLFSAKVLAIGISPADAYINFIPNQEYIIDYTITSYRPFEFYTQGAFSEFTRIETLSQSDTYGHFSLHILLPAEYDPPGKHRLYVAAAEKPMPGTVNALAIIRGFVEIEVPFPGYYAEMTVDVKDVNQGEPVIINVLVQNKGKFNITDARVELSVLSEGKELKKINTDSVPIETTAGYTFQAIIEGGELKSGRYSLNAKLYYADKTKEIVKEFKVGTFDIAIVSYTNKMFNGTVNPFEIEVESLWNNKIDTVYMDLAILNGSKVLSTAKTPPFDLLPWAKKKSSFYWNTEGIPIGSYDLQIALHYNEGTRTEERKIYIVENIPPTIETPVPVSTIILLIIAVVLVGFNVYFIIGKRKKDKKESDKDE